MRQGRRAGRRVRRTSFGADEYVLLLVDAVWPQRRGRTQQPGELRHGGDGEVVGALDTREAASVAVDVGVL
eukprot:4392140-Prymnesium_polylepis.2